MQDFLTYFFSHMPTNEEWAAFLLVNLVAYVAARNTVLRRERQLEKKAYTQQVKQLEQERRYAQQLLQEQEQQVKEHWAMIQRQANQIDRLTQQLNAARELHFN